MKKLVKDLKTVDTSNREVLHITTEKGKEEIILYKDKGSYVAVYEIDNEIKASKAVRYITNDIEAIIIDILKDKELKAREKGEDISSLILFNEYKDFEKEVEEIIKETARRGKISIERENRMIKTVEELLNYTGSQRQVKRGEDRLRIDNTGAIEEYTYKSEHSYCRCVVDKAMRVFAIEAKGDRGAKNREEIYREVFKDLKEVDIRKIRTIR